MYDKLRRVLSSHMNLHANNKNSNLVKQRLFVIFRHQIEIFGQIFVESPYTNEVLHFKIVPVQIYF